MMQMICDRCGEYQKDCACQPLRFWDVVDRHPWVIAVTIMVIVVAVCTSIAIEAMHMWEC